MSKLQDAVDLIAAEFDAFATKQNAVTYKGEFAVAISNLARLGADVQTPALEGTTGGDASGGLINDRPGGKVV